MISAGQVADAVVEELKEAETAIAFACWNPKLTAEVKREEGKTTIQVYPLEESEELLDRGDMVRAERVVNVLLQCPLDANVDRDVALLWLNEIKEIFRELELVIEDPAGGEAEFKWNGNSEGTLYDADMLAEKKLFVSVFKATFFSFC